MYTNRVRSKRKKKNSVENFRPVTYLLLMWKLLTGMISEDMYCFMENEKLLPAQQKGCLPEEK